MTLIAHGTGDMVGPIVHVLRMWPTDRHNRNSPFASFYVPSFMLQPSYHARIYIM